MVLGVSACGGLVANPESDADSGASGATARSDAGNNQAGGGRGGGALPTDTEGGGAPVAEAASPPGPVEAGPEGEAGISSIDSWIAFDSESAMVNRDVYVIRPDGSGLRRLTMDPARDIQPRFSPDGRKLAFASDRSGVMQIYILDLASGAVSLVPSRAGAQYPSFSPDGQRIAYRAGAAVYTVGLDGSGEVVVVAGSKCCSGFTFGGPVFTADGQWIVYDDYNAIYALHPDGTGERTIVPPTTGDQSNPTLSPDGTSLALQSHCRDGIDDILAVPFSGVSSFACDSGRRVSPTPAVADCQHPSWGPGNAIAWDIGIIEHRIVLWKDGVVTGVTNVADDDRDPSWSPPGTIIP